jgi:hypothetical protein
VTEAKGDQILPEVSGEVMVFQDRRRQPIVNDNRNDWDVRAQISGDCVGPTAMRWRDMWAKVTNGSDAEGYRMATDEEHNVFVVWDEVRDPNTTRQVYIQKFDKHGVPRWDLGGVRVSDPAATSEAKLADVAVDNNKGAQVVWQQTSGGTEEVVYAHIGYDGILVEDYNIPNEDAAVQALYTSSLTPVIVFTPETPNIGWGAWVAFIGVEATGDHERYIKRIEAGTGMKNAGYGRLTPPVTPSEYSDLKIVHHGADGVHLLSRWYNRTPGAPVRQINVTTIVENAVPVSKFDQWQDQFFNYTDFTGYDIDVDVSWPVPHRPLLAVTLHRLGFAGVDLHIVSYNASFAGAGSRFSDNPWIYPVRSEIPSLPTVASDHVDVNGYGGMLLAVDVEYTDPITSLQRHKVQTAHVELDVVDLVRPPNSLMDVAIDLTAASWPDIAYAEPQFAGQEPMSMIVWEGGGETSSCSPPRPTEVYSQYVGYQSPYDGLYWNEEKMVAPGPGNYHQRRPTIQPSEDGTYTTFWLDTWGGTASPMGTRMYHIDGDNMGWKKRHPAPTPQSLAVSVYPNPVGPDAGISIQLVSMRDQHARVLITDALGRTVAQLHDGMLREGVTTISSGLPRGQLLSGTYFVSTLTQSGRTVTSFIVLR